MAVSSLDRISELKEKGSSGNTFAMLGILPTSLVLVTFIVFFLLPVLVVTFSNGFLGGQDSIAEEDVDFEMNLSQSYFS